MFSSFFPSSLLRTNKDLMYQEAEPSLVEHGHNQFYSVNKLLQLTVREPIVALNVLDIHMPRSTKTSIQSERLARADPKIPIIVIKDEKRNKFIVLDGIHRLWLARYGGVSCQRDTLPARIVTQEGLGTALISRICAYCFNLAIRDSYDGLRVYCAEHARLVYCCND